MRTKYSTLLKISIFVIVLVAELFLQAFALIPTSSASCQNCRHYVVAFRTDQQYTGVRAYVEKADPQIRDSVNGFSAEVIWIGDISNGSSYIEVGWRKTGVPGQGANYYWEYTDAGGNHFGPYWGSGVSGADNYSIEYHSNDGKWHVYYNGSERGSASLGTVVSGYMEAGGEVTDQDPNNLNAMGVAAHRNLAYQLPGSSTWFSWGGWSRAQIDNAFGYNMGVINNYDAFQSNGHN